ncbi:hypothetical protein MPSEU_000359900 [Mayamaea pseudoterrestris]|nr:hypothetical protein MPSEU_000359900 [Mayamaea pseudoterrestris]
MPPRTRRSSAKKNYNEDTSANDESSNHHTVEDCLHDIGITSSDVFEDCQSLDDEFRVLKKIYFSAILEHHPDKGGDAATFRKIRTAFEVLRELYTKHKLTSFTTHLEQPTDDYYDSVYQDFSNDDYTPSYEHYYHAAQEQVPGYKVERAKSNRSQCVACRNHKSWSRTAAPPPRKKAKTNTSTETTVAVASQAVGSANFTTVAVASQAVGSANFIAKDSIRIGSLDDTSGSYGRWHHLDCWRVPYRIWAGLTDPNDPKQVLQDLLYMDEVLLTNLVSLSLEEQGVFVAHVMDESHWARQTAASKPPPDVKSIAKKADAQDVKAKTAPSATAATKTTRKVSAKATRMTKSNAKTSTCTTIVTTTTSLSAEENLVVVPDAAQSTAVAKRGTTKEHFVIPRPGANGALEDVFHDKKFVLTGLFPEVGGGTGLSLGKARVRAMIESFGGVVTSGISGKTDYLVVGKEPGQSKVANARARKLPMVDLKSLQTRILGQAETLELAGPPPKIQSYSAGYQGSYLMN